MYISRLRGRSESYLSPVDSSDSDEFSIPSSGPSRLLKGILVVVLAVALVVATFDVILPSTHPSHPSPSGPPPVWHSFTGVFSSSRSMSVEPDSLLASKACNLTTAKVLSQGTFAYAVIDPAAPVFCSFAGQTYQGIIGTDCNLSPTGVVPVINGSQIPYEGCELSYAPLSYLFPGLFNTTSGATNTSIAVYSNKVIVANITTSSNWTSNHCSISAKNSTGTTGSLSCLYLGIPYSTTNLQAFCSFNTQIQTNGVAIPKGGCVLERSEQRS
jgi:hypothetical protein